MGFLKCDFVYAFGLKPTMEGDFCSDGRMMLSLGVLIFVEVYSK